MLRILLAFVSICNLRPHASDQSNQIHACQRTLNDQVNFLDQLPSYIFTLLLGWICQGNDLFLLSLTIGPISYIFDCEPWMWRVSIELFSICNLRPRISDKSNQIHSCHRMLNTQVNSPNQLTHLENHLNYCYFSLCTNLSSWSP